MWFSFWRSRRRFSLDELRYVIDQLMKVQVVNEVSKDFVIEALRSIAELITYGDQHDTAYFEFFMEKQVMGEFLRILRISRTVIVSLQLLQTMSIMIQNLKSEHSIYYMFSNEYVNSLINYSFDFRNEELLSYYISFLRAISGKLNQDTISLLVMTQNDEVISFPLYVEAIRFAFHEEILIRTAVRALTLNVYHVGDDAVNRFVSRAPHADYFMNLVQFFREQCNNLNLLVSHASENLNVESSSSIVTALDEIEDNLYYFSDVVSAGIPDVGRLIMDNILTLLLFPLILPSLRIGATNEPRLGAITSLYLLCCILRIVKIKDMANTIAASLLCRLEAFAQIPEAKLNGRMSGGGSADSATENSSEDNHILGPASCGLQVMSPKSISSGSQLSDCVLGHDNVSAQFVPREALLSFITSGDDVQVSGALCVLSTLLQTKELDESMVDALGILPQRKQHKKKLLWLLVVPEEHYGVSCSSPKVGASPHVHKFQVLDALVSLFCRSSISAETLWDGGWLLRQLLPHSKAEFNSHHLRLLRDSFYNCRNRVLEETRGTWPDHLLTVFHDEWKKCKKAIEASSPRQDPKCMLLPPVKSAYEEPSSSASSFTEGERMCETVKVFVLLHHLHIFSIGGVLPDKNPLPSEVDIPETSRAKNAGLHPAGPKPNTEINLVDAVPCRIAFERGKEWDFHFLATTIGNSGWLVLAEELSKKPHHGVIRVAAPLAGCNPRIDEKHTRWLHLRIRPSSFPLADTSKHSSHGKVKSKALVDGRWTLAFRDEESCKCAVSMILEELSFQSHEAERNLKPLLELNDNLDCSSSQLIDGNNSERTTS